MIYCGKICQ